MNEGLLTLLLSIGTASLVPMATSIAAYFGQKLRVGALDIGGKKWEQAQLTINTAIKSAEQAGKVGTLATNIDKKKHAMALAKVLLAKQKIRMDDAVLSELIEANVWETKNAPEVKAPTVEIKVDKAVETKVEVKPEVMPQPSPEIKVGDVIENAQG